MEEEGEVHRRGPLALCPFGGEEYCCVENPFGLEQYRKPLRSRFTPTPLEDRAEQNKSHRVKHSRLPIKKNQVLLLALDFGLFTEILEESIPVENILVTTSRTEEPTYLNPL
jgi:hypothetical protein